MSPWSAYSGGGQRSTHDLASALAHRGHDVTVIFTKAPWEQVHPPPSLPYRLRWAALVDYKSRARAPLRVLTAWTVASVVRRELATGAAIVHAQGEEAARLRHARAHCRFGLVVTPRYPSLPRALFAGPRSPIRGLGWLVGYGKYAALGFALRAADVCAPPSHYGGELIRRAYQVPPNRIQTVHNGAPREFLDHVWQLIFRSRPPSRAVLRPIRSLQGPRRLAARPPRARATLPLASGSSAEAHTTIESQPCATSSD